MCRGEKRICAALMVLMILVSVALGLAMMPELSELQLIEVGGRQ